MWHFLEVQTQGSFTFFPCGHSTAAAQITLEIITKPGWPAGHYEETWGQMRIHLRWPRVRQQHKQLMRPLNTQNETVQKWHTVYYDMILPANLGHRFGAINWFDSSRREQSIVLTPPPRGHRKKITTQMGQAAFWEKTFVDLHLCSCA